MAEGVVSPILECLLNLLKDEVNFLSGVSDQVRKIYNEFEWMQCFLRDVDARKDQDQLLQKWVKEIRTLAYRAENAIEMYAAEVSSRRGRGIKKVLKRFACILSEAIAIHKVGAEIANIKGEINQLKCRLQAYDAKRINRGEGPSSGKEKQRLLRKTYGHQVEEYFVGMQDDMRDLVSLIMDDDRRHRVVSIWAMGGAGKTTIAQKIYNHTDVRRHFDGFAWVCIIQECQFQSVFKDILKQLTPDETKRKEIDSKSSEQVIGALYQLQKERRCLIVLDDIWKLDDWRCLQPAFPTDASYSKVLLTTRIKDVADVGFLHELKFLKEDEALELLRKKAFPGKVEDLKSIDPEFETLGKEMVRKCGNHPLAVSVIGGILSRKYSVSDWKMVNDNMDSHLKGSEQNKEGRILQVLALSYNELPYHLKLCFLCLGLYDKFLFQNLESLYCMWMAEGIVLSKHRLGDESMMDVAERYLDELADMSMVQVEIDEFEMGRNKKTCRFHDLMRDLCLEKAKEEEFFELRRFPSEDGFLIDLTSNSDLNYGQLRFLFFRLDSFKKPLRGFGKFKFLRILFFHWVLFVDTGIPKEIGKLIHLRLLSFIECGGLTKLPSAIGDLAYLQTLELYLDGEIEIPNVLWKLKRLRHLYVGKRVEIKGKDKLRLDGLGELEVLSGFDTKIIKVGDLSKLTKLHSFEAQISDTEILSLVMNSIEVNFLHIKETHLFIECDFVASIEKFNLFKRVLMSRNLRVLEINGYIGKLPNYEPNFLQSLVKLELRGSHIEEDPMQMMGKLPKLETLYLKYNAYAGREMSCRARGFSKLRSISICTLDKLENWSIDEGAMSSLSYLSIVECPKLEMIPDGLRFIKTLHQLRIEIMPQEFKDRIRLQDGREGVDFDKVSHVPDIRII